MANCKPALIVYFCRFGVYKLCTSHAASTPYEWPDLKVAQNFIPIQEHQVALRKAARFMHQSTAADVDGAYHDALDLALFPEFAHDALQLSLPLFRQLLAAEVVPGLVQQLRWLCRHLLQRVLLQLILCEDCSTSEPITQPGLVLQGL